jgi:membrane protease subunit (stomatin/prohibitin family)
MVATTGNAPSSETAVTVQLMSGPRLVTSLGDNFKAYIRSWRDATIDAGSPINIYINPQVIKVQEAQIANVSAFSDSYEISTQSPASDTYPTGAISNNYQTKYVFKTPLTFTILESGVLTYITFKTAFDQE